MNTRFRRALLAIGTVPAALTGCSTHGSAAEPTLAPLGTTDVQLELAATSTTSPFVLDPHLGWGIRHADPLADYGRRLNDIARRSLDADTVDDQLESCWEGANLVYEVAGSQSYADPEAHPEWTAAVDNFVIGFGACTAGDLATAESAIAEGVDRLAIVAEWAAATGLT